MKLKSVTTFHVKGLNQEKWLNELCKEVSLTEIERLSKNETTFKCSYFSYKKVDKFLKKHGVNIVSLTHEGVAYKLRNIFTAYGLMAAIVVCFALSIFSQQYILQYKVEGVDKLAAGDIVEYVSKNFSKQKGNIDTSEIENALLQNFKRISFASCIIKGQTLVINIKEKLLPDEMYGDFAPIVASKNGRVTKINLISGTLKVAVGDFVRMGDVLVEPYTIDASGNIKKVEARAEILAEVYNEGQSEHYETYIEVRRTGKAVVQDEIKLFGLTIYTFKEEMNFKMFETETDEVPLIKNLFLPFKMKKTTYYELCENKIISKFEDVEQQFVSKAKAKALENCEDYAKMKEEFYTLRHLQGMTIVNFCIITEENICK